MLPMHHGTRPRKRKGETSERLAVIYVNEHHESLDPSPSSAVGRPGREPSPAARIAATAGSSAGPSGRARPVPPSRR